MLGKPRLVAPEHQAPVPLSPERQALADKLAEHAEAVRVHAAIRAAVEEFDAPARVAVRNAEAAVAEAGRAVEVAREAAATALMSAVMGRPKQDVQTVQQARTALQEAEDNLDAAIRVRDDLQSRLEPAERTVGYRLSAVERLAQDVIRAEIAPHAAAMGAQLQRVRHEFAMAASAYDWLVTWKLIERNGNATDVPHVDGERLWKDALAALASDATAPLPVGGLG